MQYLSKKIDNSYIVWYKESNQWIQFEEPAWYVNKQFQKGLDRHTIAHKCSKKYQLNQEECLHFVTKVYEGINESSKPASDSSEDFSFIDFPKRKTIPYTTRYYNIEGKRVVFEYNSRLDEYYIHPPFAHLETDRFLGKADLQIKILSNDKLHGFKKVRSKEIPRVFSDYNKLKRQLFIELLNTIYNKTKNDWLSFVHASALTDGKQTVLLSSSSGSGKSSMAALLQTKGLQLVSDDFVPIDAKFKRAFPFPAAMSIKKGAFSFLSPYYGNLHDKKFNSYKYTPESVRYLPPIESGLKALKPKPVKNIIFIKYNPKVTCEFNQVPTIDALKLFHDQAWVSPDPKNAKTFINWFVKLNCYQLEFGDSEKGMDKIMEIFKQRSEYS